ncbi:uncharacterized protein AB9W97_005377 isoform 2-T2 [Spinachia spinachia]
MFKMKGLALLCLWGLFHASTAAWPPGGQIPMSGPTGVNITANTSLEQEERGTNNSNSQATATPLPVESTDKLTPPKDEERREPHELQSPWHPFSSNLGFPGIQDEEAHTVKPS